MLNYCTLFNSAYLSRGLAMYYSLEQCSGSFHLYIFAFDEECYKHLRNLELKHATIISLSEFEDEELLSVKPDRTAGEYCWTCTSSTIWYCIKTYALDQCTYIDADLLFFSDPKVLIDEMGDDSVLITSHNYSPEHDQSALSGIYCVQFITFKNTEEGMRVLNWWRKACIEWCYRRFEDGKFGDQKYLDDWTERFTGVHVLQNPGGGVAPWNNLQYQIKPASRVIVHHQPSAQESELVFYHFHDFRYCKRDVVRLTAEQYSLTPDVVRYIYKPYISMLTEAEKSIRSLGENVTFHEPLLDLDWIMKNTGRKFTFFLTGHYKNYYKRGTLK
ncbi:glycosyl transferase [Pararcticibacter amylolyticus]|uniref:Glycosyl transferase n=2 Tax=Pararcticibacter amylolyticus TaxID=2173175 RepID=A0A2U2PII3_9SPHI|nr:glycosyl transferase [Pararcticibacter amylolyticus]